MFDGTDDLQIGIYGVLSFFSMYDRPLSAEEVFCYLPGLQLSLKEIKGVLDEDERIVRDGELYCLKGNEDVFTQHNARSYLADELWARTFRYVRWLRFMPFVKMVAVGNTLAFDAPGEDSDIDLFIVSSVKRLFFVRILVTLFFQVLGVRRYGKKVAGRFCLSFYVSENGLSLKKVALEPVDVYLYYWIATLQPVFGLGVYRRFLRANNWFSANTEFCEQIDHLLPASKTAGVVQRGLELFSLVTLVWWLEPILMKWQISRANKKYMALGCRPKHVVISKTMLKFHDLDARERVQEMWGAKMEALRDN